MFFQSKSHQKRVFVVCNFHVEHLKLLIGNLKMIGFYFEGGSML